MKRSIVPLFLLVAAVGCDVHLTDSTKPLYTENDLVQEDAVLGNWMEHEGKVRISVETADENTYRIPAPNPKAKPTHLHFRLLKLGDHYFIDLDHRLGGHTFGRIALLGNSLYVRSFHPDWLKARCKESPEAFAHTVVQTVEQGTDGKPHTVERLVLTGDTLALQTLVLKYVDDPSAFRGTPTSPLLKVGKIPIHATGLASKKQRTFNYWYEVRMAIHSLSLPEGIQPDAAAGRLEGLSRTISNLPTLGVDLSAAECAAQAATTYKSFANRIRERNDESKTVEAFFRGLSGDPFGVALEQLQADEKLKKELVSSNTRFAKTRLFLTDRYEIEFPSIP